MSDSTSAVGKGWPKDVVAYIIRQDIGLRDLPEGHALPETGWVRIRGEEPYLDGPVSPRVAVLDLDVSTATLRPGARFVHGVKGRKDGWYEVPEEPKTADFPGQPDPTSDAFLQVSVWATVLDAIRWFEHPEVLGRQTRWAFGAPQLLVIPRAGEMANAFYHRDTHSLQFFSVPAATGAEGIIHTALSRDIVVHETAHAILDGVAPDLLGAITPQARALHESVADLAAIFASLRDKTQIFDEVTFKGRDLQAPTAFSRLAEQLGTAVHRDIGADALRDANNDSTLNPNDPTTDRLGRPNHIADVTDVHGLSSVLTGAVFRLFLRLAQARRTRSPGADTDSNLMEVSDREERTVLVAAERIARMAFRAMDYLPPGELSFADFGRAVLTADQVVQPRGRQERDWLVEELVRRKVVDQPGDLDVEIAVDAPELKDVDVHGLDDDSAARSFVSANRGLFGLPPGGRFTVHPRVWLGRRSIGSTRKPAAGPSDLVVKVSWPVVEDNDLGPRFPARRVFRMGTTLVLDAASRRIKARLQGGQGDPSDGREARHVFLSRLVEEGLLRPSDAALGPDGVPLSTPMVARSVAGSMVAVGGARMLHWTRGPGCLT